MIAIILMILSLLLDGVLTNYLPYMTNDLSLFTPLLTVVTIFIICPFYYKQTKKYLIHVFCLGFIYDLCYTNLLFWNGLLFVVLALLSKFIYKNLDVNWFKQIFLVVFIIAIYESMNALIIFCFQLVPITFSLLFYKILHSLILNILYVEIIYFLLKLVPKKYKKITIN